MATESRVKKSLLNARVNLIFYFLSLVLTFFSRRIFLNTLGVEFLGLTGTLYNLLGFLNLAELGIDSAIAYVLYKPLFDGNKTKINEIVSVLGYLYRWIGLVILFSGCLLACFLPLIFPDTEFSFGIIYFAYLSFLTSSLLGYFINYRQTLLGADQKNYVVTAYFQSAIIIKTLIQLVCAYYVRNYYLWITIEIVFCFIHAIILNWKINQVYPWLKSEVRLGKELFKKYPEVMKYTKQIFVHKLGGFVQFQTMPFFIYTFVSLQMVTFYGNYSLIVDKLYALFNNFLSSTNAGVGNLIAERNEHRIKSVFWELAGIRFFIGGIICTFVLFLLEPFVSLWVGSEFILPHDVLLIVTLNILVIFICGEIAGQFVHGYGLFYDVWSSVAEVIIFVLVAVVGGAMYGLVGVLSGRFVSIFIIRGVWKPYFLYKKGFKTNFNHYWIIWIKHLVLILLPMIALYYYFTPIIINVNPETSFFNWSLYALIVMSSYMLVTGLLMYTCVHTMRSFCNRMIALWIKKGRN